MGKIVQRLKKYVDHLKISTRQIETSIGVSNGTLAKPFLNGKAITTDTLEKFVAKFPDLNPVWLITGEGNMIINKNPNIELKETFTNEFSDGQKEYLKQLVEELLIKSNTHYKQDLLDTKRILELEDMVEKLKQKVINING
ncbi:hypothetical protein NBT05_12340 [Aquimarina sp. ERC-38]|uniref:hypothetical protein n=1 Tax=Aquimarina sp. ERC-38 TaxID=2949996 RepID=UPI002246E9ED|nr:hypothetical protein [Aquimarina sp. ERC-38]UZO79737.1 hypothetical protein NBT05_12340 [Aquimarina sp. ERC-38]